MDFLCPGAFMSNAGRREADGVASNPAERNAIARVIFAIVSRSDSLPHLDIPCGH